MQFPPFPGQPDLNYVIHQLTPFVALILMFMGVRWVLRSPVGEALAERIRHRSPGRWAVAGEDPEKMLNQLIVDMRSQLAKAKQQVAAAIADEKRLSAQVDTEKKSAEDWERRAVLAVQEGRDDLAKQALLRHNEHAQGAVQLHETWIKHREETEKLKLSLRQLNDRIEEAKRKKNILIARQKRAEAHKRIQETMSSIG